MVEVSAGHPPVVAASLAMALGPIVETESATLILLRPLQAPGQINTEQRTTAVAGHVAVPF